MTSISSDSNYYKPLQCRVHIDSIDGATTYDYDSFAANPLTEESLLYCRVNLSTNHSGTCELQISNEDPFSNNLDTLGLTAGALLTVDIGKTQASLTRIFRGVIREQGFDVAGNASEGGDTEYVYNVMAAGLEIRFNERVGFYISEAAKQGDGITYDTTDANQKANALFKALIDSQHKLPGFNNNEQTESQLGYIDSSTLLTDSNIQTFIGKIDLRFLDQSDVISFIEENTGARCYVDVNGKAQLRADIDPTTSGRGFLFTNNPDPTNDDSATTGYFNGPWGYTDSYLPERGYCNQFYSIMDSDPETPPTNSSVTSRNNNGQWLAQKFKPRYRGLVLGTLWVYVELLLDGTEAGVLNWPINIYTDSSNQPGTDLGSPGGIYFRFYDTNTSGPRWMQVDYAAGFNLFLDTNSFYWIVLKNKDAANHSATATYNVKWYHDNSGTTGTSATGTTVPVWTVSTTGPLMHFYNRRPRKEVFNAVDTDAYDLRKPISTFANSVPLNVTDRLTLSKYLVNSLHDSSKPTRLYQKMSLIPPNNVILPGDPVQINDIIFQRTPTFKQVQVGTIGDVTYEFGRPGGASGKEAIGHFNLQVQPVGVTTYY